MNERKYPGAKWWKFDFHTHTPASFDFKNGYGQQGGTLPPEKWLRNFMEKKIDCVAITDHNSGQWIDKLKEALSRIQSNKPDWYHPLYLFPGVEISANGNVHVLAIFDAEKSGSDVDKLIGEVGYKGTSGKSDAVTENSLTKVVDIVVKHGGIAIPAHVDIERGLFEEIKGNNLKQVLSNENIFAMELCDEEYEKPQVYIDEKLNWTEVQGSDLYNFENERFGTFTWVKMDEPSIEGLKLALIDGTASIDRNMNCNPNQHTENLIEKLTISNAKYVGRPKSFNCKFSPFMNTIIGGRGSGKSTMLEFIRLILKRNSNIPESLKTDLYKYFNTGGENLLLDNSKLSIVFRKGDVRYRLNWSVPADKNSLEEEIDGEWVPLEGDIFSLFPVQIYSQKQIFELARNPKYLLEIIDQNEDVKFREISEAQQEIIHKIKNINLRLNSLEDKVSQSSRLKGELTDVEHQIRQIEQSGHRDVLQSYRKRKQQLASIQDLRIRENICDVLEGGLQAFEQRYKRIHLKG